MLKLDGWWCTNATAKDLPACRTWNDSVATVCRRCSGSRTPEEGLSRDELFRIVAAMVSERNAALDTATRTQPVRTYEQGRADAAALLRQFADECFIGGHCEVTFVFEDGRRVLIAEPDQNAKNVAAAVASFLVGPAAGMGVRHGETLATAPGKTMTIAHGFTCPKCSILSARAVWRPECDACDYQEPPHCCVCRSEQVVALCPEHGYRCADHAKTHAFCNKLITQ